MADILGFRRLAPMVALAAVGALTLASCSSAPSDDKGADGGSAAAAECGTVPVLGANDPAGLLDGFSTGVQDGYNGYPYELQESAWADWKPEKTEGFTAAIVGTSPAAPFIATYQKTLATALADAGVDVVLNAAPNDPGDVPGQLQQFSQAIALKPDIIFLNPIAPEPALDLVEEAHAAGIPVVSVVVPIDSPYAVSLTYNAVLQSMESASGIFGGIGGSGDVLEVTGVPGIPVTAFFEMGRDEALKLCPDINIVGSVEGMFQPSLAQQVTVQYLSTNPTGVDAVIQGGTMGWAIRDAFIQSGQPVPPIQDLGASQGMAAFAAENPDYIYYGTATPPVDMAKGAVQVGLKILAGAGVKVNHIVNAPVLVDRSNLSSIVDASWSIDDPTDLAPADSYLTSDQIAEFFANPELGPQSAG